MLFDHREKGYINTYSLLLITCQKTTRGFSEKLRVKSEKAKGAKS